MSVRGAIWGRWWYISDGPRWEMEEVNFLSSLLLFKAIWFCTDSEDLLQHLNWVSPVTRLLSLKKGNIFNRLSPIAFRGQLVFILLACEWAKGTDIWILLLRRSVVRASLIQTSEHGILTEAALCRNRGLRGTFLTTKLLNLAISLRSSQTFSSPY